MAAVPVIIDLGKKRSKAIKSLKRGRGKLVNEVDQAVAEVVESLGAEAQQKEVLPVVLIYKKKQKRGKGLFSKGIF